MAIKHQVHSKFAVILSTPGSNNPAAELSAGVERFSRENPSKAVKSVGVEYLEGSAQAVLSLGYVEGAGYPVRLHVTSIGRFGDPLKPDAIATALEAAADKIENVICHEFYVDGTGEFFAVFLAASLPA